MGTNGNDDGETGAGTDTETDASDQNTGGQSTGGRSASGQSTGGQSTGGQSTGGQSTGGQSTGGQSTGGQSTGGQSTGGQPTGGQSGGGQATAGQPGASGRGGGRRGGPNNGTGLEPNVAGALCYAFGWLTGLLFFATEDEDDFIRFHAAQSMVVFGGLTVLWIVLSVFVQAIFLQISLALWRFMGLLVMLLYLAGFLLWLGLMFVAYQGRWYELPIAGDIANDLITGDSVGSTTVERKSPEQR